MELKHVVLTAWKRRWIVLWVLVLAVGLAALFASTRPARYESTATIALTPDPKTGQGLVSSDNLSALLGTYAQTAKSTLILSRAEQLLGRMLPAEIDTSTQAGTGILRISAVSRDPNASTEAARAVAQAFQESIKSNQVLVATLVDPPSPSTTPIQPRPPLIIGVAAVLGLFAGLAGALAIEQFRRRIDTPADVAEHTHAPVIGRLPRVRTLSRGDARLIWELDGDVGLQESYRGLRTNLEFITHGERQVLQVTSPEEGQGKSTVVANLGVAFAQIGVETIIVDADLRRPRQHQIFGLDNRSGLSTMLALGRTQPTLEPDRLRQPLGRAERTGPARPDRDAARAAAGDHRCAARAARARSHRHAAAAAGERCAARGAAGQGRRARPRGRQSAPRGARGGARTPADRQRQDHRHRAQQVRAGERCARWLLLPLAARSPGGAGVGRGRMRDHPLEGAWLAFLGALVAAGLAYVSALDPLLSLAGLGAAALVAFVVLRRGALLLLFVAALPWEGSLGYPSETVSVVKLLGVLLLAAWVIRLASGLQHLDLPGSLVPVALFAGAMALSLMLSPDAGEGLVKSLRYVLYMVFLFLVIQLTDDRAHVRSIIRVFVLSAAAAAAWALYRFLIAGDVPRAAGPITDPNDFGYLQACVLPLAGYLLASEPRRRLLWGLCFALMSGAVLASLSRGALVGLGGLAIWALATRRVPLRGVLLAAGTAVAVGALALVIWSPLINDRLQNHGQIAQQNVNSRVAFWSGAVRMWEDHPFTGVGVDRFGLEAPNYVRNSQIALDRPVAHNAYLEVLAEMGAVGLLPFLAFLATTWTLLSRAHRAASAAGDLDGRWMAAAMQGTLVVAIVSATFISAELTMPLWLVGALAAVITRLLGTPAPA